MEIKTKVNKWDLIKLQKHLYSKGNYKQGEKTTLRMVERNSKWNNWQGINFQNIQQLIQLNTRKTNNPIKKWEKDLNRNFSKEDIQMANKHMKRGSTSLITREMKIKTTMTSHWSEWPLSKSLQTISAGEGVEKRECSCTVGGNVNWYSHYERWYGDSLKN